MGRGGDLPTVSRCSTDPLGAGVFDYDSLAASYAMHRKVHPAVVKELVDGAPITRSSRILEVGCGTGNYIRTLNELTGCESYGIDPSREMLSKAHPPSPSLRLSQGRAEELEYDSDWFDLVFSVDVIHHIADRASYFSGAARVLKPGAKVCTVTDSEWIIRNRVPLSVYFPETVEPELRRYPRISELRGLMLEAGFSQLTENHVEFEYTLTDVEAYRRKVFSSLSLISEADFQRGLRRMEEDLRRGPIRAIPRYVLLWGTKSS